MKKKALQVVNIPFVLPYYFGDQIAYLKEIGLDVQVACSPGPELDKFADKYEINRFPIEVLRKIDVRADLKSLFQLIRIIKRENFEYVIGHTPKGALLAMLASKIAGVKHRIYFRHGIVFETSTGLKKVLMMSLERLTSSCATKVVSVSNSVLKYADAAHINSSHKNILLNKGTCNGIDFNRFKREIPNSKLQAHLGINDGDIVLGFVGRLVNDKGINELINAWKIVKDKGQKFKLLLVGPYEERDAISEDVKNYILEEPSILHTDLVEDTVPYYDLMDVFILPSYREGFPTVVLEASAMELPVITTKSTGCIDSIQENITGLFVDLNGEDIASKILYYFKDEHLRKTHGANGREWVKTDFDQQVVWQAIREKIFKI